MALQEWHKGQTCSVKAQTKEECILKSVWNGYHTGGMAVVGVSGRTRRCCPPAPSTRCTVVGSSSSINGLSHDKTTAWVGVPFSLRWLFGGGVGGWSMKMMGENISLL